MFIDTHCHLSKEDYENLDEIIAEMKDNIIIVSGCSDKTNLEVLDLVEKHSNIYGTLGIHPEEADNVSLDSFKIIENNLNNPKIVGVGEIGLDYYWKKDNKEKQLEIFEKQIELALKYNKAIVIHSRDSINDTLNIIKKYNLNNTKVVVHCFSSSLEIANELVKLNVKLGIGGVVTFKNNHKLVEVVKNIDLKNLLLETDSPYLSPEPLRGKQNKPSNCYIIAQKIAEIKNIDVNEVLEITTINAINQFDLANKF